MTTRRPDAAQDAEAWPRESFGNFIYVPLAWRMAQNQFAPGGGPVAEIEEALKDLDATYLDLPIADHLLDLVRRA